MYCKECGKKINEAYDYCTNCGASIDNKKSKNKTASKIKSKSKKIIVIIVFIIIALIGIFFIFKQVNNSNEEILSMLKNSEYGEYIQENSVKIGTIKNISYKDYNKMALYSCKLKNNQVVLKAGGIILYNDKTKDNRLLEPQMDLTSIIYYLNTNNIKDQMEKVADIISNNIEKNGIDQLFQKTEVPEQYREMGKEIGKVVGVKLSRSLTKDGMVSMNPNLSNMVFLYKKDEISISYIGTNINVQEFAWSGFMTETGARLMANNNYKAYKNMIAIYGEPYRTVTKFVVYEFKDGNSKEIGRYDSLNDAKNKLNLEDNTDEGNNYNKSSNTIEEKNNNLEIDIANNNDNNLEETSNSNNIEKETKTTIMDKNEQVAKKIYYIYDYNLKGKSFEEVENYLSQMGLKANIIIQNKEIPYPDERVNTYDTENYKLEKLSDRYEEGETVNINVVKYVAKSLSVQIGFTGYAYAKYNDEKVVIDSGDGYVSSITNQKYFSVFDVDKAKEDYNYGKTECAFKLIVNGIEMNTSESNYKIFTFNNDEEITFKVVAPYLCTKDFEIIGENVCLFEKTISINEFYSNTRKSYITEDYLDYSLLNVFNYSGNEIYDAATKRIIE